MRTDSTKRHWVTIDPPLATADRNELARLVKALASVPPFDQLEHRLFAVEKVRKQLANRNGGSRSAVLPATVMVLADFADQGW